MTFRIALLPKDALEKCDAVSRGSWNDDGFKGNLSNETVSDIAALQSGKFSGTNPSCYGFGGGRHGGHAHDDFITCAKS